MVEECNVLYVLSSSNLPSNIEAAAEIVQANRICPAYQASVCLNISSRITWALDWH